MRSRRLGLLVIPAVVAASLLAAAPAQAEPLFGTTVSVQMLPSNEEAIGGTANTAPVGGVLVTLGSAVDADVDFQLLEGVTVLTSCTITVGDTSCSSSYGPLSVGSHTVIASFTKSSVTQTLPGALFVISHVAPVFHLEWQDASGGWVNGDAAGLPFFGALAMRCTITNGSNGPIDLVAANGSLTFLAAPTLTVPLTGPIPAGGTRVFPIWSGTIADGPAAGSCSGSIEFADLTGGGGGTGGGVIPITGTIEASPTPAPGRTVTVSGDSVFPPVISSFRITLDGVEVPDSPRTISGPDFDFTALVVIPAGIAPGTHTIAVGGSFSGRDIVYAQWQFTVPTLAATGADAATPALFAAFGLAIGAVLLLLHRRRRPL